MSCSPDLRQRVVDFVRGGVSKAEAARRFKVGEASVYCWLKSGGLPSLRARSLGLVSETCYETWQSRKTRVGYQEHDLLMRKQIFCLCERFIRRSKQPTCIDECGFASSTVRRYGYAPKGHRVDCLVLGHRQPRTSFVEARKEGRLVDLCCLMGRAIRASSMSG